MDDDDAIDDVFSSSRLWKQSTLFEETDVYESSLFAPLQLDIPSIKFDHPYAQKHNLDRDLRLPDLETFEFGPLPELDSLDESSISIETLPQEPDENIWEVALELGPANKDVLFYTWESFERGQHVESHTPYITERGPTAFDDALIQDGSKIGAGRILKANVLLQSLWNLGLGRSSILFQFNAKLRTFEPTIQDGRASGVSLRAAKSFITQFIYIGNTFLYLRSFSERTFASTRSIPAKVALATSISSVLSTLEDSLGKQSVNITSLIQLQHQFSKPREILIHLAHMVDAIKYAKTNEQLASIMHHRLLELEEGESYLRQLSSQILRQVSGPSLESVGEWLGIRQEQQTVPIWECDTFVTVEDPSAEPAALEFTYRSEMMPRFITPEDGNMIFETGNSLRFLKTKHPEHPLARTDNTASQPPGLDWGFEWQDIDAIAARAKDYEARLRQTLLNFSKGTANAVRKSPPHSTVDPALETRIDAQDLEKYFEESIQLLDASPKPSAHILPDELHLLLDNILLSANGGDSTLSNTFSPPLSLASALSFRPLIVAQAKLVNAATVRLFFRSHELRLHLSLQRQYHLLGDGVFSSLLATALFDPERESAERHKGKMRSGVHMGLQLGSRTSWPPASSELRLALRGVLSESYYSSVLYHSSQMERDAGSMSKTVNGRDNDDLPGQLNFAIRHLTEIEQERVMDPDALAALDFLRLQYVPPPPLNLVITSLALEKYDTIFKFLLRLLRMLFVVSHLPRYYSNLESRQLRMEAHHFVTVLAKYVFQTGIAEHWNEFDSFVTTIETRLRDEDAAGEIGTRVTEGIASLRDAHDKCLDSILFSLLLRRRQRKIMSLVEEIFDHILLFAKLQNPDAEVEESVNDLHAKLKGKIRVFLSVCRGLTGKKGYGKGKGTAEEDSMERLVVGMEMNGYFAA
ncbi:Spc98 family-domain-containing protein [Pyrenochaeta sp. MPI-SDFR-AT-0127]|nr:Spc98 family-domain-containing protein [Pyrenochaeta sp. MPI-SDFR-AT-0127]